MLQDDGSGVVATLKLRVSDCREVHPDGNNPIRCHGRLSDGDISGDAVSFNQAQCENDADGRRRAALEMSNHTVADIVPGPIRATG